LSLGAGAILGTVAVTCLGLGAVSAQQAIALGLPGALLIISALIEGASPSAATNRQLSFQAGFQVGWLVSRFGSVFRQRRNGF
jgi:hypothetical protein